MASLGGGQPSGNTYAGGGGSGAGAIMTLYAGTLSNSGSISGSGGGGGEGNAGAGPKNGGTGGAAGIHTAAVSAEVQVPSNLTLVSNAQTSQAVPTKGDMVMTYTNGAGTAVINTNIKGYVSRDGGTTYTQGTLVSQGTTGGHTIASFHDLDISGQPSGSSMRYKIETLVQSASMGTRIQAVSLGWS